ncbi:putative pentatricopeptide repeat-containing protein [Raphanus sativus]|nr:putative pentatricopeptide repeat-containing protein [Raphanus sativus]
MLSRLYGSLVKAYANLNMFGQAIDIYCYSLPCTRSLNFIITRLNACGEHDMALSIFRKYGSVAGDADDTRVLVVQAYRKVVVRLCHEMKMDEAEELVDDMEKKKRGIGQDVCVYSAIIEAHRKTMNFPRALQFFNDVVVGKGERKMKINRVIASSILECCCHMGKFEEAYDLFKQFRDLNVSLDRVCYNVAFDALVKLGQMQEAIELFRGMTRKGISPDVVNYTTLIGGCCAHGKVDQALDLVMEMEKNGITPDIVTYNVLAGGIARNGDLTSVNRTLELMESRGLKPTNLTHNMVIQGLVVADKTEEADAYYKGLEHDRGSYDATFIKAYCKTGRLDEAFERFNKLNFPLPKNVYFILFSSLCASQGHHIYKAQLVLNRMYKLGVEPGKSMHGIMIGAWCRVRNVVNARRNFKVLLNSREITPDKYTYTTMINNYCLMERFDEACVFFKDMKKRRVVPDLATYTVFEDHSPIHDIMREMKARNFEPDLHYYTFLIHKECEKGGVENAEYIFRHMVENGVEPDDVAYAALINCYCKNGCEDKAQKLIHEMMVGKGMTPFESCMVTYALLKQKMVENGMMTPFKACEDLYALIHEMLEKGMRPSKACVDLYVMLKQKMVQNLMITPAKACEDLYPLMQEMMEKGMKPPEPCMDLYVRIKQESVETKRMTPSKACEDLYLLIQEMLEKGMTPPVDCKVLFVKLIGEMMDDVVKPPEACKYLYVIFIQEMVENGMLAEKACKEVYVTLFKEMMVEYEMRPPEACGDLYVEFFGEMVEMGERTPKAYMDLYVKLTQGTVENGMT